MSTNNKLQVKEKIAYALGEVGNNFSWTLVSSYLMYFWTDVYGVGAAFTGTIMFLSRFWDAVNDPMVGSLADRTKTRWGRYRPWIGFATLPLAVINILTFTAMPISSQAGRNAYAFITFFVLVFAFTCVNIPYTALHSAMTLDPDERSSAASFRFALGYMGMMFVNNMTLRIVGALGGGNEQRGFFLTAVIFSLCVMVPCHLICFKGTREIVTFGSKDKNIKDEKVPFIESVKCLKGNTPVLIICFGFFVFGLYNFGRLAAALYYFTYNAGNRSLFATFSLFHTGGMILGAIIMPAISKRVANKATSARVGYFTIGIAALIMGLFLDPSKVSNITIMFALQFIASSAQGVATSSMFSMIPDTTEYTQHKYGLRAPGFISSTSTFAMKTGMAISSGAIGWILAMAGYVPNAVQNATTLSCINIMFNIVPGVFAILYGLALFKYKLDKSTHQAIVNELGLREEQSDE